uniref:Uncharacterized protein n=1 Tax=uncultured gamma proteobacterium HF4000_36I10 TaxID=710989 RepID=E0XWF9_9GAMM|nr:hypothetical protein [uncultured gamma proteobacterium HF4000_36I10]
MGFEREAVGQVVRLVDINEYKRRQAAIGTRITERGFAREQGLLTPPPASDW